MRASSLEAPACVPARASGRPAVSARLRFAVGLGSAVLDAVASRVALASIAVVDDALGRDVSAKEPQHLLPDDPETVRHARRQRDGIAFAKEHLLVLAAFLPGFRRPV